MSLLKESLKKGALEALEYKKSSESNIVSILWKDPELFFQYDHLTMEDFSHNCWKVFFIIAHQLVVKEDKRILDDITVGLFLKEHPKLLEQYNEYGGLDTIRKATTFVSEENLAGFILQNNKWKLALNLIKSGISIENRLKDFIDMSAEEIYDEYEAIINHSFIDIESEEKAFSIGHNIDSLIVELNEGLAVGLPLYNSPLLTKETGGNSLGHVTICGGLSGTGKSTFARNVILPSVIDQKERIVVMINEEDLKKVQRELIVWVANNIFHKKLQKYTVRNGNYKEEILEILHKAIDWIKENEEYIRVIAFKSFSTSKAIKVLKKYSALGVKYFILDTFKTDSDAKADALFWMNMKNNMVKIYNVVKPSVKNIHVWATFQLSKNSSKQRYYTQENIGESKSLIDTVSTCIMIRNVFDDEFEGEKRELKAFKCEGKSNIPVKLKKGRHYQLLFIVKNREGASNDFQIVVEHDLSTNVYNEIGLCRVPCDF